MNIPTDAQSPVDALYRQAKTLGIANEYADVISVARESASTDFTSPSLSRSAAILAFAALLDRSAGDYADGVDAENLDLDVESSVDLLQKAFTYRGNSIYDVVPDLQLDNSVTAHIAKIKREVTMLAESERNLYLEARNVVAGTERCVRCKGQQVTMDLRQIKSADEPMTSIYTCTSCGHEWRVG